jgi:hypothetical protein
VSATAGGDPRLQVAVMRDGLTRFWVRHEGLGWFGFNLPVERARTLARDACAPERFAAMQAAGNALAFEEAVLEARAWLAKVIG